MAVTPTIQEILQTSHTTVGVNTRGRWFSRGYDRDGTYKPPKSKLGDILERFPDALEDAVRWGYGLVERRRGDQSDVRSMTMGSGWPEQRRARWSTDRLLELTADRQPWYGSVHYYDTHTGYNYTEEHLEAVQDRSYDDGDVTIEELKQTYPKLTEVIDARLNYSDIDTVGDLKRRYDASIRTVDEQIGRMLDTLDRRGERDDTVVVLTSDRGECLTEHGVLFNHAELYDESWQVPMLVDAPGFEGTETGFVQHFDILPTVLDLLDRSYDPERFDGVFPRPGWRAVALERCRVRRTDPRREETSDQDGSFQVHPSGGGGSQRPSISPRPPDRGTLHLARDLGESENVAPSYRDRCRELDDRMKEWIASLPGPERVDDATATDADTEVLDAKLEALGYKFE